MSKSYTKSNKVINATAKGCETAARYTGIGIAAAWRLTLSGTLATVKKTGEIASDLKKKHDKTLES